MRIIIQDVPVGFTLFCLPFLPQGGGRRATPGDLTVVHFPWVRNGLRFDFTQVAEGGVI